jgi:hypothetical protein
MAGTGRRLGARAGDARSPKRAAEAGGMPGKPRAARRHFWVDPRFALGLLLIVASVVGVVSIVGAADSSVPVYAARESIAPGELIDSSDLVSTSVRLEGAGDLYLVPSDLGGDSVVVTRAVARGELVPLSAVGSESGVRLASVVVSVKGGLAASIDSGSVVDVWSARQTATGVFDPPAVIVAGATVVRLIESQGFVVDSSSQSVEVLVPRDDVARVLEAVANDDAVSVVPTSSPVK